MPAPARPRPLDADAALVATGRTVARLSKILEVALTEIDLTLPQYRALVFLEGGTVAPSALAGLLTVSRPTITALVDGLVARGFVERRPNPDDRRRVDHHLTEAGRQVLDDADRAVAAALTTLLTHLDDRDRRQALAGLASWRTAVDRARDARLADR